MGRLTKEDIFLMGRNLPRVAVETGTCEGVQLKVLTEVFKSVYGIEINEHYFKESKRNVPDAMMILGDSRKELPHLFLDEPMIFFLDAHYCSLQPEIAKTPFPLWEELELIRKRYQKDIIVVDDVHTFGVQRRDLRYTPFAKEWESVTPSSIMEYFPGAISKIYKDSFIIWL